MNATVEANDQASAGDDLDRLLAAMPPARAARLRAALDTRVEARLREAERRLRLAQEAGRVGTYEICMNTGRTLVSPRCLGIFGLPPDRAEMEAADWRAILHPEDRDRVISHLRHMLKAARDDNVIEYRVITAEGTRWLHSCDRIDRDAHGRALHAFGAIQDITERKEAEDRIWRAAHHDSLTGLANRLLFGKRLSSLVDQAAAEGGRVGLIMLDLDRLKVANDSFGHAAGDALLRAAADRIAATAPAEATVARLGGDEFAVVAPVDSLAAIAAIGGRAVGHMRAPLAFGTTALDCGASAGAAIFPDQASGIDGLLRAADTALCVAKLSGRGRCLSYAPGIEAELGRLTARARPVALAA